MDMGKIRDYFDRHASRWDGYQKTEDAPVIEEILDRTCLTPAARVLDVACGTGVLTPFLARRGVKNLTAVDISTKMAAIFKAKFPGIPIVTGNYEERLFPACAFSRIIIFNAFPHFENELAVFENSFFYLKPGGKLFVAHSMNRAQLDAHHRKAGMEVRDHVLIANKEFRRLYCAAGFSDVLVENKKYFFSCGTKRMGTGGR